MQKKLILVFFLCLSVFFLLGTKKVKAGNNEYDVIVYGASSSGVIASIAAKKEGASVLLIGQNDNIGGLTSSGLGATDMPTTSVIGGLTKEFYKRVYAYYLNDESWFSETREEYFSYFVGANAGKIFGAKDDTLEMMWTFEPKVAQQIFIDMLNDYGVEYVLNEPIDLTNGVTMDGLSIKSITTVNGNTYFGKQFIDATYEGDLMALSQVSYVIGRESNATYGETMNGILPGSSSDVNSSPYIIKGDPDSGLLPFIEDKPLGNKGESDGRGQAYCFRFTLTTDVDNQLPITKPENYHPEWYETRARVFLNNPNAGHGLTLSHMPNEKTDTNQADFVGMSYEYAEGDYLSRNKIDQDHKDYVLGLLYFLSTDERVPKNVRNEINKYGLAKDEYLDNDNFPIEIYLREGRRMVGNYVMSESDIINTSIVGVINKTTAPYSIGQGSYWFDSHKVAHYINEKGQILVDGSFWKEKRNYPISYKSIVPKKGECDNLFVTVCISSSHAAYGSIRMEPTYMIMGESAGTAAVLSIINKVAVQDLDYLTLMNKLASNGQLLGDIIINAENKYEQTIVNMEAKKFINSYDASFLRNILKDEEKAFNSKEELTIVKKILTDATKRCSLSSNPNILEILYYSNSLTQDTDIYKLLNNEEILKIEFADFYSVIEKLINLVDLMPSNGYVYDWLSKLYQDGHITDDERKYFSYYAQSSKNADVLKTKELLLKLAKIIDKNAEYSTTVEILRINGILKSVAAWDPIMNDTISSANGSNLNTLLKNFIGYYTKK